MILSVHPHHPEPRKIRRAVEVIQEGGIIAYPTDTVYGLGGDPTNKRAVDRIYAAKGMDRDQPLAILCSDLSGIARYALVTDWAYRTMRHLVPGPYTFVLPATRDVPKMLRTRQKTIGIRVPANPVAHALLAALETPLISTSATREGEQLLDARDIADAFADLDLVLDGGFCGAVPSTVLSLLDDQIEVLRGTLPE